MTQAPEFTLDQQGEREAEAAGGIQAFAEIAHPSPAAAGAAAVKQVGVKGEGCWTACPGMVNG